MFFADLVRQTSPTYNENTEDKANGRLRGVGQNMTNDDTMSRGWGGQGKMT